MGFPISPKWRGRAFLTRVDLDVDLELACPSPPPPFSYPRIYLHLAVMQAHRLATKLYLPQPSTYKSYFKMRLGRLSFHWQESSSVQVRTAFAPRVIAGGVSMSLYRDIGFLHASIGRGSQQKKYHEQNKHNHIETRKTKVHYLVDSKRIVTKNNLPNRNQTTPPPKIFF